MPVGDLDFLFSLPLKELEAVLCLFSGDGQLRLVGSLTGTCQPFRRLCNTPHHHHDGHDDDNLGDDEGDDNEDL